LHRDPFFLMTNDNLIECSALIYRQLVYLYNTILDGMDSDG
jgi:hypothetical protein